MFLYVAYACTYAHAHVTMLSLNETFPEHSLGFTLTNRMLPLLAAFPQPILCRNIGLLHDLQITYNADTNVYELISIRNAIVDGTLCVTHPDESVGTYSNAIEIVYLVSRKNLWRECDRFCQLSSIDIQPIGTVNDAIAAQDKSAQRYLELITAWAPDHFAKYLASMMQMPQLIGDDDFNKNLKAHTRIAYINTVTARDTDPEMMYANLVKHHTQPRYYIECHLPSLQIVEFLIKTRPGMWLYVPKDIIKLICGMVEY